MIQLGEMVICYESHIILKLPLQGIQVEAQRLIPIVIIHFR